jgi:hypothetical protein
MTPSQNVAVFLMLPLGLALFFFFSYSGKLLKTSKEQ